MGHFSVDSPLLLLARAKFVTNGGSSGKISLLDNLVLMDLFFLWLVPLVLVLYFLYEVWYGLLVYVTWGYLSSKH